MQLRSVSACSLWQDSRLEDYVNCVVGFCTDFGAEGRTAKLRLLVLVTACRANTLHAYKCEQDALDCGN